MRALAVLLLAVIAACDAVPGRVFTSSSSPAVLAATPSASSAASATARPATTPSPTPRPIADVLAQIDPAKLDDHMRALASFQSRHPLHPGHAKAVAYLMEQLSAIPGVVVQDIPTAYNGVRLDNILATIAPPGPRPDGLVDVPGMICAHYDSTANRTPGWRPAVDPAPGADDNATGTAALLEFARVVSIASREQLRSRLVLAFFDGEELFFKGSAAYVSSLPKPYKYKAAINLDMVGFNPLADRLDLLWYTSASAELRDRVLRANQTYGIGVSPLNAQFAADGNTIMDAAPFGIAGIPSIALCQRYGGNDATVRGNYTFHTVNDTPDKITNKRLWLKAAKLTLATALELARS